MDAQLKAVEEAPPPPPLSTLARYYYCKVLKNSYGTRSANPNKLQLN